MEVYLDLVVILNFMVDFLLLLGTNRLSGFPLEPGRCALAAALGAVYSGACLLPGFRFLGNLLWRCVSLGLMSALAFGLDRSAWKRGGLFVLLSMSLGGIALSLGRRDLLAILLGAGVCLGLCWISFGGKVGGQEYVNLTLTYAGQEIRLLALLDTGNSLRDPITGEPVLVVSGEVGEQLLGLTREQLRNPLQTMLKPPAAGLRLIPYRAVGSCGMLLGLRMQNVLVGSRQCCAIVAFAPEGLGRGEAVQALVGS